MSLGGYYHQEPSTKVVLSKLNQIVRFVSLGPVAGGLVVGLAIFFMGSQLGVHLSIMIPASLVTGVLSATVLLGLGAYIEKRTIGSSSWLQDTIDEVTSELNKKLSAILFEGRLHLTLSEAVETSPGNIHLPDSSSITIHPVSKELITLKLQQAAIVGTTATEKIELSKYGYTKYELDAWRNVSEGTRRFHLVCFIDVPQYSLNEFELYSCRIEDLVVRTLEITSRKSAKTDDMELARSRFRDLVDKLVVVQAPASDGDTEKSSSENERLSSMEDSRRFRVEIQNGSESTQNR